MENYSLRSRMNVRRIAVTGILSALSILLSMVPSLGYIPIGPITITTMHIPVIIAALLEGPVVGGIVGLIFGLSSLYMAATVYAALPTSIFFLNPLVSILPRILIGIVAYYAYIGIKKLIKNKTPAVIVGAVAGTATNTVGVLGMIYILYAQQYVEAIGESAIGKSALAVIFGGVTLNMVAEILMAAFICTPVVLAVNRTRGRSE